MFSFRLAHFLLKTSSENENVLAIPEYTLPSNEISPTPFLDSTEVGKEFESKSGDMKYIKTNTGCWECSSHATNKHGYPVVSREGKLGYAHRWSYQDTKGPIPPGNVLLHSCDNRKCMNPDHLTAGTQLENIADRVAKGRSAFGEANGRAKLTEQQVKEILQDTVSTKKSLARQYHVDPKMIRNIKNKVNWSHITVD